MTRSHAPDAERPTAVVRTPFRRPSLVLALALVVAGCAGLAPPPLICEPPLVKRTRVVAQRVPVNQGRGVVVIERKFWVEECVQSSTRE
jgi:hypothetical protein